jgi:hypothetical protein
MFFSRRERVVAVIGYPGHGKTVFLAGMFWDSFFTLSQSFQDERRPFSVHTVTEEASKVFIGNGMILNKGGLPPPNPRTTPAPATLEFKGVPSANGRNRRRDIQLTFYDMAGESFKSDEVLRKDAPFLPKTDDIIFLFDPTRDDFEESVLSATDLLDRIYRVVPTSKRKHFIVALSKIDELRARDEWWTKVTNQTWFDFESSLANLSEYVRQMDYLSRPNMLRSWWTDGVRQAQNFINGLPPNTHFCALSSLGHQPVWECPNPKCRAVNAATLRSCQQCQAAAANAPLYLSRKPEPFRVRDPLFWIFREAGVM